MDSLNASICHASLPFKVSLVHATSVNFKLDQRPDLHYKRCRHDLVGDEIHNLHRGRNSVALRSGVYLGQRPTLCIFNFVPPMSVRTLVKLAWYVSIQENLDSFAYSHLNIVSQLR
jgi:hypothetical protein